MSVDPTGIDPAGGTRRAAELAADLSQSGHALPAGTRLHDYVITGLLGEGGFGIVYLALDESLQREVALKEYLPSSMAGRAKDTFTVLVRSRNHEETFAMGLKSFVNEARLLARFDHPALVKVHRFWEANGTAYMVMPYYRGPTLKATLAAKGQPPDEAELRRWLWPLMDALTVMHAANCYHRDIAPDNILITTDGPLLLDFGAARRVIGDMTQALTVVLKPGFAPIEQYGDLPGMTQGPWTDVYALASVLYAAISGHRPVPSVERLMDDRLRPLSGLAAEGYRAPFLQAIDAALALRPKDRPQSIEAFRQLMNRRDEPIEQTVDLLLPTAPAPAPARPPAQPKSKPAPAPAPMPPTSSGSAAAAPARSKTLVIALSLAGLLVLAAIAIFVAVDRRPAATPTPQAQEAPVPAAAAPASAPQPTPAADLVKPPAVATEPAPQPAPPEAEAAAPKPTPLATRPVPAATRPAAAPAKAPDLRAKCSDILQKASLEPLSAGEKAFLRKECR